MHVSDKSAASPFHVREKGFGLCASWTSGLYCLYAVFILKVGCPLRTGDELDDPNRKLSTPPDFVPCQDGRLSNAIRAPAVYFAKHYTGSLIPIH